MSAITTASNATVSTTSTSTSASTSTIPQNSAGSLAPPSQPKRRGHAHRRSAAISGDFDSMGISFFGSSSGSSNTNNSLLASPTKSLSSFKFGGPGQSASGIGSGSGDLSNKENEYVPINNVAAMVPNKDFSFPNITTNAASTDDKKSASSSNNNNNNNNNNYNTTVNDKKSDMSLSTKYSVDSLLHEVSSTETTPENNSNNADYTTSNRSINSHATITNNNSDNGNDANAGGAGGFQSSFLSSSYSSAASYNADELNSRLNTHSSKYYLAAGAVLNENSAVPEAMIDLDAALDFNFDDGGNSNLRNRGGKKSHRRTESAPEFDYFFSSSPSFSFGGAGSGSGSVNNSSNSNNKLTINTSGSSGLGLYNNNSGNRKSFYSQLSPTTDDAIVEEEEEEAREEFENVDNVLSKKPSIYSNDFSASSSSLTKESTSLHSETSTANSADELRKTGALSPKFGSILQPPAPIGTRRGRTAARYQNYYDNSKLIIDALRSTESLTMMTKNDHKDTSSTNSSINNNSITSVNHKVSLPILSQNALNPSKSIGNSINSNNNNSSSSSYSGRNLKQSKSLSPTRFNFEPIVYDVAEKPLELLKNYQQEQQERSNNTKDDDKNENKTTIDNSTAATTSNNEYPPTVNNNKFNANDDDFFSDDVKSNISMAADTSMSSIGGSSFEEPQLGQVVSRVNDPSSSPLPSQHNKDKSETGIDTDVEQRFAGESLGQNSSDNGTNNGNSNFESSSSSTQVSIANANINDKPSSNVNASRRSSFQHRKSHSISVSVSDDISSKITTSKKKFYKILGSSNKNLNHQISENGDSNNQSSIRSASSSAIGQKKSSTYTKQKNNSHYPHHHRRRSSVLNSLQQFLLANGHKVKKENTSTTTTKNNGNTATDYDNEFDSLISTPALYRIKTHSRNNSRNSNTYYATNGSSSGESESISTATAKYDGKSGSGNSNGNSNGYSSSNISIMQTPKMKRNSRLTSSSMSTNFHDESQLSAQTITNHGSQADLTVTHSSLHKKNSAFSLVSNPRENNDYNYNYDHNTGSPFVSSWDVSQLHHGSASAAAAAEVPFQPANISSSVSAADLLSSANEVHGMSLSSSSPSITTPTSNANGKGGNHINYNNSSNNSNIIDDISATYGTSYASKTEAKSLFKINTKSSLSLSLNNILKTPKRKVSQHFAGSTGTASGANGANYSGSSLNVSGRYDFGDNVSMRSRSSILLSKRQDSSGTGSGAGNGGGSGNGKRSSRILSWIKGDSLKSGRS